MQNQTLIIETTANIFNKSVTNITSQFYQLQQKLDRFSRTLNNISTESQKTQITTELEGFSTIMLLMITRYQSIQNSLIDLITDVKHGKPHPSIITPKQIKGILEQIQKEIPKSVTVPIHGENNNLLQIHQLSHIRLALTNDKVIFEFRIPLPSRHTFQLFKIHSLPAMHKDKFIYIKPSTEYLSIDYDRQKYYQMNNFDFKNCLTSDLRYYLCRTSHPIFLSTTNNNLCEIQLLKHTNTIPSNCKILEATKSNFWIQLSQPNKWLFSTFKNLTIDEICESKITPFTLQKSGVIEISKGCYLKSSTIVLYAHDVRKTSLNNFYIPSINITSHFTHHPVKASSDTHITDEVIKFYDDQNFKEIFQAIENQKKEETTNLQEIHPHLIHNYSVSYSLLFTFVICLTIIAIRKYKTKRNQLITENKNQTSNQPGNSNYKLTINTQTP